MKVETLEVLINSATAFYSDKKDQAVLCFFQNEPTLFISLL